jgi:hypothetical protein
LGIIKHIIRNPGKCIKEKAVCSAVLNSRAHLQDYHSLHLLVAFTVMLHKLFVSFIAAFTMTNGITVSATTVTSSTSVSSTTVTSSVAVSATLVAGNDGGFPPPSLPPVTVNECDTGLILCCDTYTSTGNPDVGVLTGLLDIPANPDLGVGLNCFPIFLFSNEW